jgi:hypothetical protein
MVARKILRSGRSLHSPPSFQRAQLGSYLNQQPDSTADEGMRVLGGCGSGGFSRSLLFIE